MARRRTGYMFRRGNTWWLRTTVDGKRVAASLEVTEREEAEKIARETLDRIGQGTVDRVLRRIAAELQVSGDKGKGKRAGMLISEMWEKVGYSHTVRGATERALRPSTAKDHQYLWGKFAGWARARVGEAAKAAAITPEAALEYRHWLEEQKLSPARVNLCILTCRVLWRRAGIVPNPWTDVRRLPTAPVGRRELTLVELRKVVGKAKGELRLLLLIGAHTALRLGRAVGLRWEQVSWVRNEVGFAAEIKTTKRAPGWIPMHAELRQALEQAAGAAGKPADGWIMPGLAAMYERDRAAVGKRVQEHLGEVCKLKTTESQGEGRRRRCVVGFHSLRHSFISQAARSGASLAVLREIAGHGPTVQERYLHASDEERRGAVDSMPRLGSSRPRARGTKPARGLSTATPGAPGKGLEARSQFPMRPQ